MPKLKLLILDAGVVITLHQLISSGDAIVFKVLGNTGRGEQGISLEEILQRLGLSKPVDWQYTKEFREKYDKTGSTDRLQNRGWR